MATRWVDLASFLRTDHWKLWLFRGLFEALSFTTLSLLSTSSRFYTRKWAWSCEQSSESLDSWPWTFFLCWLPRRQWRWKHLLDHVSWLGRPAATYRLHVSRGCWWRWARRRPFAPGPTGPRDCQKSPSRRISPCCDVSRRTANWLREASSRQQPGFLWSTMPCWTGRNPPCVLVRSLWPRRSCWLRMLCNALYIFVHRFISIHEPQKSLPH